MEKQIFLKECPACVEMKAAGLSFEETHSPHVYGKLLIEKEDSSFELVDNPHIRR